MKNLTIGEFMEAPCTDVSVRWMAEQFMNPVTAIATAKGISEDAVLEEAIKVLTEDGVSNRFAWEMINMWKEAVHDNEKTTAREAMLMQHIYWTNVLGKTYMTNSLIVDLKGAV